MATATESAWTSEPFRLGPPEQFSRARELLMRAGFEETPLCARASEEGELLDSKMVVSGQGLGTDLTNEQITGDGLSRLRIAPKVLHRNPPVV